MELFSTIGSSLLGLVYSVYLHYKREIFIVDEGTVIVYNKLKIQYIIWIRCEFYEVEERNETANTHQQQRTGHCNGNVWAWWTKMPG